MTQSIPKPNMPPPRRRSSIGQAAMASRREEATAGPADTEAAPAPPAPMPAPPATPGQADTTQRTEAPESSTRQRPRTAGSRRQAATSTAAQAEAANKRLVGSKDILLSLPEDLKQRMVNTITWTQPHTGIGQQQKFIRRAISELCDRLERQFNSSQPFPPPAVADE